MIRAADSRNLYPNGGAKRGTTPLAWVMASKPKAQVRLSPIMQAYLDDLAKLGAYGKGRSGVMRRFIENGVKEALEKKMIEPRDVGDFASFSAEEGDDED